MLGIRTPGASLPDKVVELATGLPGASAAAAAVSACVIVLVLGLYIPPYLADWYRAAARMLG